MIHTVVLYDTSVRATTGKAKRQDTQHTMHRESQSPIDNVWPVVLYDISLSGEDYSP
jgi:hypothetical protein